MRPPHTIPGVVLALMLSTGFLFAACSDSASTEDAPSGGAPQGSAGATSQTAAPSPSIGAAALGAPCANPGDRTTVDGQALMCDKDKATGKTITWMLDPNVASSGSGNDGKTVGPPSKSAPACPSSLEGILTASMIDEKDLSYITPLGNVTPPGHTAPIDHQYVLANRPGSIALRAPAHSWLVGMSVVYVTMDGKTYEAEDMVFELVVCKGFVLSLATGVKQGDLAPRIAALLPTDTSASSSKANCGEPVSKAGHAEKAQYLCYFSDMDLELQAGDLIGTMVAEKSPNGGYDMKFETWAANYLIPPPANGINWDWYFDDRYVHATCLYDLFTPELRAGYQAKYGVTGKDGVFQRRTIAPVCGVVSQDEPGTLRGYWFANVGGSETMAGGTSAYGENVGISFIRYNIDPSKGAVVVGGGIVPGSATVMFDPKGTGTIDRDPVEVTPDGKLYCYNASGGVYEQLGGKLLAGDHRFVVTLKDATHLLVDYQEGICSGSVKLGPSPTTYYR